MPEAPRSILSQWTCLGEDDCIKRRHPACAQRCSHGSNLETSHLRRVRFFNKANLTFSLVIFPQAVLTDRTRSPLTVSNRLGTHNNELWVSVSDFFAVIQLASKVRRQFVDSPKQFTAINNEDCSRSDTRSLTLATLVSSAGSKASQSYF